MRLSRRIASLAVLISFFTLAHSVCATQTVRANEPLLERERWRMFMDQQGLSSLYINDLAATFDQILWIATDHALVRYNGRYFMRASIEELPPETRFNRVLCAADGSVWAGTSAGIVRGVGNRWELVRPAGDVTAITQCADGAIWAAVSLEQPGEDGDAGIHRFARGRWTHFGEESGLPMPRVHTIFGGEQGSIIVVFGDESRTDAVYEYSDNVWRDITEQAGISGLTILSIAQTPDGAIWFGTRGQGVCRWDRHTLTRCTKPGIAVFTATTLLPMSDGTLWAAGSPAGTVWSHRDGAWTMYPVREAGVSGERISKMIYTLDNAFWFTIPGRGMARFDRRGGPWWTYDQLEDLPATASVSVIRPGVGSTLWIGTTEGLLRFDGNRFVRPSESWELRDAPVSAVLPWPDSSVWVSSSSPDAPPGIWKLCEKACDRIVTTPVIDHEAFVTALHRTRSGDVWAGTAARRGTGGYGVFRLSDGEWRQFTRADGLPDNRVLALAEDASGNVCVGTATGLARFDGNTWTRHCAEADLNLPFVSSILCASDGSVWAAANVPYAGVARLVDGEWEHFTTDDGLSSDHIWSIVEAEDGSIWFGTPMGVTRFDGRNWLRFTDENGLARDQVWGSALANDGSLWFGHFDGVISKYHAIDTQNPQTFLAPLPERIAHPGFVTIHWYALDPWNRTRGSDLHYTWRLNDGEWSPYTSATSIMFESLPRGKHRFEVRSIDQEMNFDEFGARATFIVDPPFWLAGWFLIPTAVAVGAVGVFGGIAVSRTLKYREAQAQIMEDLRRELRIAHTLQTSLLPQNDPNIEGLEVTGICIPASDVGGDYFTYLWNTNGNGHDRIGIALADVTGHAMQAAIPAVLFSGMLATASRETDSPKEILDTLNDSVYASTDLHTFVCCTVAVFDFQSNTMRIANAGSLDPIRISGGDISDIETVGNRLPLGIADKMRYEEQVIPLKSGQTFVFQTDGIVEAKSPDGELFGFERVYEALEGDSGAVTVRDRLLDRVTEHAAGREFDDDITLVVIHVKPTAESEQDMEIIEDGS